MNITAGMNRLNYTSSTGTEAAEQVNKNENGSTSADNNKEKVDWKCSKKDIDTFVQDIDKWMACHKSIKGFAECPPKAYHTDGYTDMPKSTVRGVPTQVIKDIEDSSNWIGGRVSVAGMFVSAGLILCGLAVSPALPLAALFLGMPISMGLGKVASELYMAAEKKWCTHTMEKEMAKDIVKNFNNVLD
jgi:hypothetical protein